jgi:hypothetical protein
MSGIEAARGPLTPLEQAAELVRVLNETSIPLDNLNDEDLVYTLEARRVHLTANHFAEWLVAYAEWAGVPSDDERIILFPAALEVELMAKVTWPELFEDRAPGEEVGLQTIADAVAAGLAIRPLKKERQRQKKKRCRQPTLPGCQGGWLTGPTHICLNLRVRGHSMCPTCEQLFAS